MDMVVQDNVEGAPNRRNDVKEMALHMARFTPCGYKIWKGTGSALSPWDVLSHCGKKNQR